MLLPFRIKAAVIPIILFSLLCSGQLVAQSADKADAYYKRAYRTYTQQRFEEAVELL